MPCVNLVSHRWRRAAMAHRQTPGREPALATGEHARSVHAFGTLHNFEDPSWSPSVWQEDRFTIIHIQNWRACSSDTKLGLEEITADIPNG